MVWYSMPGSLGSLSVRIAEWYPAAGSDLDRQLRRATLGATRWNRPTKNVPSLPIQPTLYVVVPAGPSVRVNVYVRVYG